MSWIITFSGRRFDILEPDSQDVAILDIAHALAHACRFAGHCRSHYSVAQHSILVSQLVPQEYAMPALLHDAAEAYVGDMVTPLKQALPEFAKIEQRIMAVIALRYDLAWPFAAPVAKAIKYADLQALALERRDLLPVHSEPWPCLEGVAIDTISETVIHPWGASHAKQVFLKRFEQLLSYTRKVSC